MAEKSEKAKNALNNSKLSLSAPCPGVGGKYSQLKFDIYQNNPRIVVRTNDPSEMTREKNFSQIVAAMDAPNFYAFLELLKTAYESTVETKNRIENWNYDFVEGQRSKEPIHLSDTWVGKDKDGCVFISVVSKKEDRPVIKFITVPGDNRWHKFYHSDGTQYTMAESSVILARSWYNLLSGLMSNIIVKEYVEPPPYVPGGGAGSNYRSTPSSTTTVIADGDLPF